MDAQSMERWNNLSVSEIRVIREIIARVERREDRIPIRAIAQSAYVSTTSIVRLAKKLGFDGFSELLYALKHERGRALAPNMPGFCERLLVSGASLSEIELLAQDIASGSYERINICGIGYSDLGALYFCNRLLERGYFASTKSPLDFRDSRKTLTVFISESGETMDSLFIQERIHARGDTDYLFTADAASSLGSSAEHCILVERRGCRGNSESDYFLINTMTLIEDVIARVDELERNENDDERFACMLDGGIDGEHVQED